MCQNNNNVKLLLENGEKKIDLKIEGFRNTKNLVKQLCDMFLEQMEDGSEVVKEVVEFDVMKAIEQAYKETNKSIANDFDSMIQPIVLPLSSVDDREVKEPLSSVDDKEVEIDYSVEFNNTDLDKYNREFPLLVDAVARNMYNKLVELQINQRSYFVTNKGVLKLQARYSCKCGNFKKHWIPYPDGKKFARCTECSKPNTLVFATQDFPATDEFGNFYVTSNMLKRAELKAQQADDNYIKMF